VINSYNKTKLVALISEIYFWNKTLCVSDSSSVHQEFSTVHTTTVYVIPVLLTTCKQAVSKPVRLVPLLCVQWKTPDDGLRNCPKNVRFYSKNKFEKLVHLVSFIIRITTEAGFKCTLNILA